MASLTSTVSDTSPPTSCSHYKRKCALVAPCCNEVFPCRLCHDEKYVENWRLDPEDTHAIDRHAVTSVVCTICSCRQPASDTCVSCNISFASYYCNICHLYDDDGPSKQIYHCSDCGICRVGGADNFVHCNVCNMCIGINNKEHSCRPGSMGNCPVCLEDLWSSRKPSFWLKCDHCIHVECFKQLQKTTIKCPVCAKSFHSKEDLRVASTHLDSEIASTPMPAEYQDLKVKILCNDCNEKTTVKFHIFGHKCIAETDGIICGSYNTRRV